MKEEPYRPYCFWLAITDGPLLKQTASDLGFFAFTAGFGTLLTFYLQLFFWFWCTVHTFLFAQSIDLFWWSVFFFFTFAPPLVLGLWGLAKLEWCPTEQKKKPNQEQQNEPEEEEENKKQEEEEEKKEEAKEVIPEEKVDKKEEVEEPKEEEERTEEVPSEVVEDDAISTPSAPSPASPSSSSPRTVHEEVVRQEETEKEEEEGEEKKEEEEEDEGQEGFTVVEDDFGFEQLMPHPQSPQPIVIGHSEKEQGEEEVKVEEEEPKEDKEETGAGLVDSMVLKAKEEQDRIQQQQQETTPLLEGKERGKEQEKEREKEKEEEKNATRVRLFLVLDYLLTAALIAFAQLFTRMSIDVAEILVMVAMAVIIACKPDHPTARFFWTSCGLLFFIQQACWVYMAIMA